MAEGARVATSTTKQAVQKAPARSRPRADQAAGESAPQLIGSRMAELGDWRGDVPRQVRKLIMEARGLKLHPFIERYVLEAKNVLPTLLLAKERQLPLLIHTDDREPNLSRGRLAAALAEPFKDVTFILAHSGAYAPGIPDQPGATYTDEGLVKELVSEAIGVARRLPNVFLETSILASRVKVELVSRDAPHDKTLIGSDYPIGKESFGSVLFQERMLLSAGLSPGHIERFHRNACQLFGISD
jgi:predicted TIM-barrel fold metal-dependent hydrolase